MNESLSMNQVFINTLTEIVRDHLADENFCIDDLSKESGISRSQIHRKLQSITHQSASQFIREIRLQSALEMLQKNLGTASEIAFWTGFNSPSYFSKCFHDYYGYPPGEVKRRELTVETELKGLESKQSGSKIQFSNKKRIIQIRKPGRITYVTGSVILIISFGLILAFDVFNIFNKDNFADIIDKDGRIPLVVMPFRNLTNDTTKNDWQVWIIDGLNSSLSEQADVLEVRQRESVETLLQSEKILSYASVTPSNTRNISRKLDVKLIVTGSIYQEGDILRVYAQLHNSKKGVIIKSFEINESSKVDNPDQITKSLSELIKNFLLISVMKKEEPRQFTKVLTTSSHDAYQYFINGYKAFRQQSWSTAVVWFEKAIEQDSNFVQAYIQLSWAYFNQGMFAKARKCCLTLYSKVDQMNWIEELKTKEIYALYFEGPNERIKYLRLLLDIDSENPAYYENLGEAYSDLEQFNNAISAYEKGLELYDRWKVKPWIASYVKLGVVYYKMGMYREERKLNRKAEKEFNKDPHYYNILYWQAILALREGRMKAANVYLTKYKSSLQEISEPESTEIFMLACIYRIAGFTDSAEVYYRKAISMQRGHNYLSGFADFLIYNDIDIDEGLELIDEAIELKPNYHNMNIKGWGFYKKGHYEEAKYFLKLADSLKPIYKHYIYLHQQEVNKAIASQKNN